MPNHVSTKLTAVGPAADLDRLVSLIFKDLDEPDPDNECNQRFDFNAVIPMPAILEGSTSGSDERNAYAWKYGVPYPTGFRFEPAEQEVRRCIDRVNADIIEGRTTMKRVEAIALGVFNAIKETGHPSWYEWSVEHWGTKWNAYSLRRVARVSPTELTFMFDTAWSVPKPVLDKLAELFPSLTIRTASWDEGGNFAATGKWVDGEGSLDFTEATDEMHMAVFGCYPDDDGEDE